MIQWWWLLVMGVAVFAGGFFVGIRMTLLDVKKAVHDKDSPIHQMLGEYFEKQAGMDAEVYAKGAELYDRKTMCLLRCGHEIAEMFRNAEKRMAKHG
jgi:hypothetical protein